MRGRLIYHAGGVGLANRLRALVGYMALSEALGRRFALCWEADSFCDAAFTDLFCADGFELVDPKEVPALGAAPGSVVHRDADWFQAVWRKYGGGLREDRAFRRCVRSAFARLPIKAELRDAVRELVGRHSLDRATGMHIRHTDNLEFYKKWAADGGYFEPSAVSRLEGFVRAFRQAETPFCFLATDDPKVIETFRAIGGERLLLHAKRFRSWAADGPRSTRVSDALIELLALSHCRSVVGTYYSSFSKLGAIAGGARYREVVGARLGRHKMVERLQLKTGSRTAGGRRDLLWNLG